MRIRAAGTAFGLTMTDPTGAPVLTAREMTLRPVTADALRAAGGDDSLFRVEWTHVPATPAASPGPSLAEVGDLAEVTGEVPDFVVLRRSPAPGGAVADAARTAVTELLGVLQRWLADERFEASRLVVPTRGAVSTRPGEDVTDLVAAPLWGLVRSAQSENPGRFVLLDADEAPDWAAVLPVIIATGESQFAVRSGEVLLPRFARPGSGEGLTPPAGERAWRLRRGPGRVLDDLSLTPCPEATLPLENGQVRVRMRAAGMNFRDVLISLGVLADADTLGSEGAGVVVETGPGVTGLRSGDRVMGLIPGAFGPLATVDHHNVVKTPDAWSDEQAAALPVAYVTAYYGLADLGRLGKGESVLVHAGTGGVGMAAIRLAQHWGADVYATASPHKWDVLRELGIPEDHLASSRTLEFENRFPAVDVVLNSLTGDFTDASLRLLKPGGRFIEMGKADIRAPEGVDYRPFDLDAPAPERIAAMLAEVVELIEKDALKPLPVRTWDVRRAPEAFRHMSQAKHTGKLVLTIPQPINPDGTALITGGTGVLGTLTAHHLITTHDLKNVVLISRNGPDAPGATELRAELSAMGADVTIAACDAADRDALRRVIEAIPAEHPLTAVVHAAGVLDDATIPRLTGEHVQRVLTPKVDAALNLHDLTRDHDLAAFVLFSSGAGLLGTPGQGNHAAANVFLDALAAHRRANGRPATSIAWGWWAPVSESTRGLGRSDRARFARGGARALTAERGMALFDACGALDEPVVMAADIDLTRLREESGTMSSLWRGLVRSSARPAAAGGGAEDGSSLARRLAALPAAERETVLLDLVIGQAATVLGHAGTGAIGPRRAFKELGFDSLTAVELRNRLNTATGLRLPATLIFDQPNPAALTRYLRAELVPEETPAAPPVLAELDRLQATLSAASPDERTRAEVTARLRAMLSAWHAAGRTGDQGAARIESASADEVLAFIDNELGRPGGRGARPSPSPEELDVNGR